MCANTITNRRVAKSVLAVASGAHPLARLIQDRHTEMTEELMWRVIKLLKFSWPSRKPRQQKNVRGEKRPTDMDLFSFLLPLIGTDTVLELPHYQTRLPRRTYAEERHLGNVRFGPIAKLISHRSLLSFSVQITDMSIVTRGDESESDHVGALRTFMMVDYDGKWQPGWNGIAWNFKKAEGQFRERYDLVNDATHRGFMHYVHPNRRHSIFGAPHLLLKLLWQRLEDEIAFYRSEMKRLAQFASDQPGDSKTVVSVSPHTGIMVPEFTMKLLGLTMAGEYQPTGDSLSGYQAIKEKERLLAETIRPLVQFIVRANEAAFYHYGRKQDYVAGWIRGVNWVHDNRHDNYRDSARIHLTRECSICYQTDLVSQTVAA